MTKSDVHLAISPIGWTNDDMPDIGSENTFQQTISEIALAGFVGSEVGSKYPHDPKILKPMLDIRGIKICSAWFSTFFADGNKNKTIENFIKKIDFLSVMGANVIGCSEQSKSIQGTMLPIFEKKPIFTDNDWRLIIEGYNELANIANDKGIRVTIHPHMGTGIQTDKEIELFMESTNTNIGLLYDTGHIYYSSGSQKTMSKLLTQYVSRIFHIHLKDVRDHVIKEVREKSLSFLEGVRKGTFAVPGDGVIDFKVIFNILNENNYKGWLVVEAEQDPEFANPFEHAVKARRYIRENTGL
ncbi:myo-inosose-2 dehydratase [Pantoea sp. Aalb]|uniref:myo-inosose-2 dehydratase n=1 Tax=Pantoea sp. Aalb TaxID=2576762 RepID=UPI00132543B0|nr:myo-inosose-2 dehydratase [Pantoea sp. Aalb]MXP67858.1 myo-inosose-2 dehydratase [Pantoea sp. Aalb]